MGIRTMFAVSSTVIAVRGQALSSRSSNSFTASSSSDGVDTKYLTPARTLQPAVLTTGV